MFVGVERHIILYQHGAGRFDLARCLAGSGKALELPVKGAGQVALRVAFQDEIVAGIAALGPRVVADVQVNAKREGVAGDSAVGDDALVGGVVVRLRETVGPAPPAILGFEVALPPPRGRPFQSTTRSSPVKVVSCAVAGKATASSRARVR
jgi:hypothetical protein